MYVDTVGCATAYGQLIETKIEWCNYSWNPVAGCLHSCPYCYAPRVIRARGMIGGVADDIYHPYSGDLHVLHTAPEKPYPFSFEPTLHGYRLDEPAKKQKPGRVFVCSMADLFGDFVPDEWIDDVLGACLDAPHHKYLFLTKNPLRYLKLIKYGILPRRDNFWYGTTITKPIQEFYTTNDTYTSTSRIIYTYTKEALFNKYDTFCDEYNFFVSYEPMLEELTGKDLRNILPWPIKWIILGAESGTRKEKVIPQEKWINYWTRNKSAPPVFLKNSLKPVWGDKLIQQYPKKTRLRKGLLPRCIRPKTGT